MGRDRITGAREVAEGHGIGRLLVPLVVRPGTRTTLPHNLATLKHRLEHGA